VSFPFPSIKVFFFCYFAHDRLGTNFILYEFKTQISKLYSILEIFQNYTPFIPPGGKRLAAKLYVSRSLDTVVNNEIDFYEIDLNKGVSLCFFFAERSSYHIVRQQGLATIGFEGRPCHVFFYFIYFITF
jgi:hypothetical protein